MRYHFSCYLPVDVFFKAATTTTVASQGASLLWEGYAANWMKSSKIMEKVGPQCPLSGLDLA